MAQPDGALAPQSVYRCSGVVVEGDGRTHSGRIASRCVKFAITVCNAVSPRELPARSLERLRVHEAASGEQGARPVVRPLRVADLAAVLDEVDVGLVHLVGFVQSQDEVVPYIDG